MPSPPVLVRIPNAIGTELRKEAKRRKLTVQAIILEALGERYRVDCELPKRGGRKKSVDTAPADSP